MIDRKPPGAKANVVNLADAARDLARQKRRRADPPPAEARGGAPPGKWTPNHLGLPREDECPVQVLGLEGDLVHLIDSDGQFRSLRDRDFTHSVMQGLFKCAPNYPMWMRPRYGKTPPQIEGEPRKPAPIEAFKDDLVRTDIFQAASRLKLFLPRDRMRGLGMWLQRGGEAIYHAGEELWTFDRAKGRPVFLETGMHEGFVYPRLREIPAPWTEVINFDENPAGALIETYRKWNWSRPEVDPVLMLGHNFVSYAGAALDWRSALLLLGDRSTGKSSLQAGLGTLFAEALLPTKETTAAGIYQDMQQDARLVACDELEPSADQKKVDDLVKLMRIAADGGFARRGGQSGQPTSYQLRCSFIFSAINNPLHLAQDLSRVAILRLMPLGAGKTKAPALAIESTGRILLAIIMREWSRFETLRDEYMGALAAGGHDARGQKTYGTLLAGADLLLGPELADELGVPIASTLEGQISSAALSWWTEHLSSDALPEIEDAVPNWRGCLEFLLTSQVEPWRQGGHTTVGALLDALREGKIELPEAKRDLAMTGLGLLVPGDVTPVGDGFVLVVPNKGSLLERMFRGSPWQWSWKDALRQCPVPGVIISDSGKNRVHINGVQERCTLVSLGRYYQAPER